MNRWRTGSHLTRLPAAIAGVAAAVAACGAGTEPAASTQVADSAGVQIIVSRPDAPGIARWSLDPDPAVTLGAIDGAPEVPFDRVVAAVRLRDGSIAVADGGSQEIRVFGSDGRFVRRVGGRGSGPGEFRALRRVWALPADTLVAYDARGDRVSYFSADGELLGDWTMPVRDVDAAVVEVLGPFRGGSVVAVARARPSADATAASDGPVRDSTRLLLVRAGDDSAGPLGWTPAVERYRVVLRADGEVAAMDATPPLWRVAYAVAGPERLFIAHNGSFDILAFEPGGRAARIRLAGAPVPVGRGELARWKDAYVAQSAGPAVWRTVREQAVRDAEFPETRPAHGELFADRAGNLWVARWTPPGDTAAVAWWVFGRDGALRASIETPAGATLLDAGPGYLLTLERDELEVAYVRLYRVRDG